MLPSNSLEVAAIQSPTTGNVFTYRKTNKPAYGRLAIHWMILSPELSHDSRLRVGVG
jgi:hypothetical protein